MVVLQPESIATPAARHKVLVVDDDDILREVMSEQLGSLGWEVATAENGEDAIQAISRSMPDLAIIDLSMPTLDGFGLLGHLRQNPKTLDLPVIVCTSHNDRDEIERAYRLGASSFVTKPISWPLFLHHAKFVMRSGETERALRQAEAEALAASRVKSAMFQVMSHELKTPLTALIGLTAVIDGAVRDRPELGIGEELSHVVEAARRLNAVVNDIMLLSKAVSDNRRGAFEPADVLELLEDGAAALRARAAERNVSLVVRRPDSPVSFMCDRRFLHQALVKLIENAVRFSPEGAGVELWGDRRSNGTILLTVRDEGPGLSPQKLKECLQPFMQEQTGYARSAEGLGLGLPIAKAVAEAHGGELVIQTAPGKGLLAALLLPAALAIKPAEAQHA